MKSTCTVLGHSLICSLVRSHHSLNRLLRTARFVPSLGHSLAPKFAGQWNIYVRFSKKVEEGEQNRKVRLANSYHHLSPFSLQESFWDHQQTSKPIFSVSHIISILCHDSTMGSNRMKSTRRVPLARSLAPLTHSLAPSLTQLMGKRFMLMN